MSAQMSRRELIAWLAAGTGAAATGATVLLNGSGAPASSARDSATSPTGGSTPTTSQVSDRSPAIASARGGPPLLVVLEMPGGNDGLSMAVPYGMGAYYDLRDQTAITQADVLRIDDEVGLHPNLAKLHKRGLTLVEGVGSMKPDGSHFEMSARWWGGNSDETNRHTGWVGRLADVLNDGSTPASALSIGSGSHAIVSSANGTALSLPSADAVFAVAGADSDDAFRSAYQSALHGFAAGNGGAESTAWMRSTLGETIAFAERLVADDTGEEEDVEAKHERLGYSYSGLSGSLEFAANVLGGNSGIRVIHVSMDGDFDTHEGHSWKHPNLMTDLDDSLSAFHNDLAERGLQDRVMVMTTSEFGRTANENASGGLDHGTASVTMLSGPNTGGRRGEYPSLTDLDENDDLKATVPFESYLAGVVEGWLEVPSSEVFGDAEPLAVF